MQRLELSDHAKLRNLLKNLAGADVDVFSKLQPRLHAALSKVQQRGHSIGLRQMPPRLATTIFSAGDSLSLLEAAAAAASRGLALVPSIGRSSSSGSSSNPSTDAQGLLCIAQCCEAVADIVAGRGRRAHAEAAAVIQSAGAQHSQLQQHDAALGDCN